MKKLSIIILLLCIQGVFAQINRFVYQVTMKPDGANKNDIKTENAYLDISQDKSLFYSENRLKRDSIMQKTFQSRGAIRLNRDEMERLRSNINYSIEKNTKDQKVYFKDRLGRDVYSYEEERPLNWKILPETTKIGVYKVQKAETDFAGRKWTAWFTTDLPYQDGPYKFNGLPGLIVKIEDSQGDYSFDLMKNYKIPELAELRQRGNVIKVKRKDFLKQQEKYKTDPMSFMNQGGGSFSRRGGNQNPGDMRKRLEDRVKEEAKNNSNPIELQ